MNEQGKAFFLGLFILGALALVIWLVLFLKPLPGNGESYLRVRFTNIDRIIKNTRVTYGGKPIGIVEEINAIPDPRSGPSDASGNLYMYELLLNVDSAVKVFSYDEIIYATAGLLGEKSIAIIPKAPPPGSPPAIDVTKEILYAKSDDKLQEALGQINSLSGTFQDTMRSFHSFLNENGRVLSQTLGEMHKFLATANDKEVLDKAIRSFAMIDRAMSEAHSLLHEANETRLVERTHTALASFQSITERIDRGEGTFGKLMHSDCLYLQLTATMAKLETVLQDINNYGLLFQYDKNWQRRRVQRINRMYALQTPCDFVNYVDQEMVSIGVSLSRTENAIQRMEMCQVPVPNACFSQSLIELLGKVEHLRESLKIYTEMLQNEYCQRCN